jgi:hypothetical protein
VNLNNIYINPVYPSSSLDYVVSLLTANFWKLMCPFPIVQNRFCKFSCTEDVKDFLSPPFTASSHVSLYSYYLRSFNMQKNGS